MFGFLGSYSARLEYSSHGVVRSSFREFPIQFLQFGAAALMIGNAEFDVDEVSATKPDFRVLKSLNILNIFSQQESYSPVDTRFTGIFGPPDARSSGPYNFLLPSYNFYLISSGIMRGWRYNSNAALSPATRKVRFTVYKPENIKVIAISTTQNNAGRSNASNAISGDVTLDFRKFINLESIILSESFVDNMTIKLPTKIKELVIAEQVNLSSLSVDPLPPSVEQFTLYYSPVSASELTNMISTATGIKALWFVQPSPLPTTLATALLLKDTLAKLDISHMAELQEVYISVMSGSAQIQEIVFPDMSNARLFGVAGITNVTINSDTLNEVLNGNSNLHGFIFYNNGYAWTRNFGNSDFSNNLIWFITYGNSISGNITLTDPKPNVIEFKTGNNTPHTGTQQNSFPVVDITGLTGATTIDLSGCEIEDLELPVNTVCTSLILFDNKLSKTTNPNLISQIRAMTALQTLYLGNVNTNESSASWFGQSSDDGLGEDLSLDTLTSLVNLSLAKCKISGILTLPDANIANLYLNGNSGLEEILNLDKNPIVQFVAHECTSLVVDFTELKNFNSILCTYIANTIVDLSQRTATANIILNFANSPNLTKIIFPADPASCVFLATQGGQQYQNCPNLTEFENLENISYSAYNANVFFRAENCAIDTILPFGTNNFLPGRINLHNNGMSEANVDGNIKNIFDNRHKWIAHTSGRVLTIHGTNAAPSGTYQAPRGYRTHAALTVTSVTKASTGVVTVSSIGSLANGDIVYFYNVAGMTELNGNYFVIDNISGNTFELYDPETGDPIDTSGFETFTSGSCRPDGLPESASEMMYVLVNQYGWSITASTQTLLSSLRNYWSLDETGTSVSDVRANSVPGGVDLVPTDTLASSVAGKKNGGFTRNSSIPTGMLTCPAITGGKSFTIAFWCQPGSNNTTIYCQQRTGTSGPRTFVLLSVSNSLRVLYTDDSGDQTLQHDNEGGGQTFQNSVLQLVVLRYNKATRELKLSYSYTSGVGGVLHDSVIINGELHFDPDDDFVINAGAPSVVPIIDEVMHWDRFLSDAEVVSLFNNNNGRFYPFT